MPKAKDLSGRRFGYLVAISPISVKGRGLKWLCKCDCGKEHCVDSYHLTHGNIKSCGCLQRKMASKKNVRHGLVGTTIYNEWASMKQRCNNPNSFAYKYYGARGIKVCDEWNKSFESYYDYVSKLPKYGTPTYTLDRINNDGNYEPGNVRWASKSEQCFNRRGWKQQRRITDAESNT